VHPNSYLVFRPLLRAPKKSAGGSAEKQRNHVRSLYPKTINIAIFHLKRWFSWCTRKTRYDVLSMCFENRYRPLKPSVCKYEMFPMKFFRLELIVKIDTRTNCALTITQQHVRTGLHGLCCTRSGLGGGLRGARCGDSNSWFMLPAHTPIILVRTPPTCCPAAQDFSGHPCPVLGKTLKCIDSEIHRL